MTEPTMSYIEKNVKNITSVYRLAHQDCHVHGSFTSHPAGLTLQGTIEATHVHTVHRRVNASHKHAPFVELFNKYGFIG